MIRTEQKIGAIEFFRALNNPGLNKSAKNNVVFFQQVTALIGDGCALTIDVLKDGEILENIYKQEKIHTWDICDGTIKFPKGD